MLEIVLWHYVTRPERPYFLGKPWNFLKNFVSYRTHFFRFFFEKYRFCSCNEFNKKNKNYFHFSSDGIYGLEVSSILILSNKIFPQVLFTFSYNLCMFLHLDARHTQKYFRIGQNKQTEMATNFLSHLTWSNRTAWLISISRMFHVHMFISFHILLVLQMVVLLDIIGPSRNVYRNLWLISAPKLYNFATFYIWWWI